MVRVDFVPEAVKEEEDPAEHCRRRKGVGGVNTRDKTMLRSFFGAYFHEDCLEEGDSPETIVERFLDAAEPGENKALHRAILEYASEHPDDEELRGALLDELGCYYDPGEGNDREWLFWLAQRLTSERPGDA